MRVRKGKKKLDGDARSPHDRDHVIFSMSRDACKCHVARVACRMSCVRVRARVRVRVCVGVVCARSQSPKKVDGNARPLHDRDHVIFSLTRNACSSRVSRVASRV